MSASTRPARIGWSTAGSSAGSAFADGHDHPRPTLTLMGVAPRGEQRIAGSRPDALAFEIGEDVPPPRGVETGGVLTDLICTGVHGHDRAIEVIQAAQFAHVHEALLGRRQKR